MEVTAIGPRFFLAVKQGKLLTVADGVYFTSLQEAQHFADDMNRQIDNGELFRT